MCGICGLWNKNGDSVDPALLVKMRDSMAHRGPDGASCVLFDVLDGKKPALFKNPDEISIISPSSNPYQLGLANRRLAIIDLNTGDQPMSNEDGSIWIVFVGEIYNYRELRRSLQADGHAFRTLSDTEVIIHAYEQYGAECPLHFNGIFTFAIWDIKKKRLFLARDHFGVKPLYYTASRNYFSFGSEIKALLSDSRVSRELDLDALNLCLTFRHTPSPWTLFKNIFKLPPGCSLTVTESQTEINQYWRGSSAIDRISSEKEWVERLELAMDLAVKRQMVSDVPIGISLSSGVDSNAILALMSRHSSGPVRCFTVGFEGREANGEIEPARQIARRFGAEFSESIIQDTDYAEFMERYIWHLEEPIGNDSAAAYYFVADMAHRQGIKVLLNGQGADEVFAGYERYLWAAYSSFMQIGNLPPIRWMIPTLFAGTVQGERFQRYLATLDAHDEGTRFLRVYSIMTDKEKTGLLNQDILARVNNDLPGDYVRDQLSMAPNGTTLEKMTFIDTRTSLPDNLLLCEDKMAMAASVEARVPFLDLEFMEIGEKIPGKYKLKGLRDKYIHRKACQRWIGKQVAARPKRGFENAVDIWLRARLGEQMHQVVESKDSFTNTYLNPGYVVSLMREHSEQRRDHRKLLFLLLSLESWYQVFF